VNPIDSPGRLAVLCAALLLSTLLSALLSATETALLALNRHRLRQHVRQKRSGALRAAALLQRANRFLAVLQLCRCLCNGAAVSLTTLLTLDAWGEPAALILALLVALLLLVAAEQVPKRLAALHPEPLAYLLAGPALWLTQSLYPIARVLALGATALLNLAGLRQASARDRADQQALQLRIDESAARAPLGRERMQLNVLDFQSTTVAHVMVPRPEVLGIDIDADLDSLAAALRNSHHARLPVFKQDLNNVIGVLHLRSACRWLTMEQRNKAELLELTQDAYFVPDSTPLPVQLRNFQQNRRRMALVVDEYGVVNGLVTLQDLLGDIANHLSSAPLASQPDIFPKEDGSYVFDGSTTIRDINRALDWQLPSDGPRTLNGLLTELLENIPDNPTGLRLPGYHAEILQTKDKLIKSVRMWRTTDASNELQANIRD